MKSAFILFVLLTVMTFALATSNAQNNSSAAETVDNLKLQLIDVQGKEEMAKIRLEQLDEALKPENIERALAGVGTTRPEELREQRKRQLTIERTAVQSQLDQLTTQRTRLESAVVTAEANAYLASANGGTIENAGSLSIPSRWLVLMGVAGALAIVVAVFAFVRLRSVAGKMS
jgi:hypothetical protein